MQLGREGSARIYQFPIGGRNDTEGRTNLAQRPAEAISGSGWYHEAAIQEAKSRQDH